MVVRRSKRMATKGEWLSAGRSRRVFLSEQRTTRQIIDDI